VPADRAAAAAAVDSGVLHCERAEELVDHLVQANDERPTERPASSGFTDVLREPELAPRHGDGRAADLDGLDSIG
jgi:hypothetical protein